MSHAPAPEVSPLLDSEGDGIPDAQEVLAPSAHAQGTRGTDPRDPRSVLRLSPRDKSTSGLTLQLSPLRHRRLAKPRLPTQPGKTYRIEYTEDLTRPWLILQDQISGDGAPVLLLDPAATTRPQRFYRLRVLPECAHLRRNQHPEFLPRNAPRT